MTQEISLDNVPLSRPLSWQVLEPLRGDTLLIGQIQAAPALSSSMAVEELRSQQQGMTARLMSALTQSALLAGLPVPRVLPMQGDGLADLLSATQAEGVQVLGCVVSYSVQI